MSYATSVSIGCKISKGRGTAAWWTQEYAVIRSETQEAYEAMHSKLASDWELFVTLRKQKNKEMATQAGSVLTGCRRDCLTVEEGAWI
jgi:hypothetical protein